MLITEIVPASLLFDYSIRKSDGFISISSDLRMYLIQKIYERDDPGIRRSGSSKFFSFDNIETAKERKCRVVGWVGAFVPETVLKLPRLVAIDMIRDMWSAYPLFAESFYISPSGLEGSRSGVFSSDVYVGAI